MFVFHEGTQSGPARPRTDPGGLASLSFVLLGEPGFSGFGRLDLARAVKIFEQNPEKTAGAPSGHSRKHGELFLVCVSPPKTRKVSEKLVKNTENHPPFPPPPSTQIKNKKLKREAVLRTSLAQDTGGVTLACHDFADFPAPGVRAGPGEPGRAGFLIKTSTLIL